MSLNIPRSSSGDVFDAVEATTVSVTTNNYTGYRLTIFGPANFANPDNYGYLVGTNNNKLPTITNTITENTFRTSTNTSLYSGRWGFSPSRYCTGDTVDTCVDNERSTNKNPNNTTNNPNYLPAPQDSLNPTTIDITTAANTEPVTYALTIGARISKDTPLDSYTNTFVLAATANPFNYNISYVDGMSYIPSATYGSTNGGTVSLSSQIPAKYGFTFKGWCTTYTTSDFCDGTVYQPGDSYPVASPIDDSLYAMWEADCNALLCMQNVNEWKDTLTLNKQQLAVDIRDNKMYWVALLKDGNVWMTQNLDLDLSTTRTLTSNDTDLNEAGSGVYVDGYTNTSGLISWTPLRSTGKVSGGTFSRWENIDTTPNSLDVGNWYEDGEYYSSLSVGGCDYSNQDVCPHISNTPYASNGTHGHLGNYYNWAAALASNNISSLTSDDKDRSVSNSICPKGWRLPGAQLFYDEEDEYEYIINDFMNLSYSNSDRIFFKSPNYFVRAGTISNGVQIYGANSKMAYYTSILWNGPPSYSYIAYALQGVSWSFSVSGQEFSSRGASVRCLTHSAE